MKRELMAMILAGGAILGVNSVFGTTVNLATLSGDYTAKDGEMLTGTLDGNYKLSIADGAMVTLNGVTIIVPDDDSHLWPGIECKGNATILLADDASVTNTISGGKRWSGIYAPEAKTLTIKGSGVLVVTGGTYGAGIGGADIANQNSGNIVIEGGEIIANGGDYGAGIGVGYIGACGDVTISGGTVTATGGTAAPGIGGGYADPLVSKCGDITISGGIVVATCGEVTEMTGGAAGIGGGSAGGCGKIEITGGNVTATGYLDSAGIGGGHYQYASSGDIVISGGIVTAFGGTKGAGIGSGVNGGCGDITIANTVTRVVSTKGSEAINSIGQGWTGSTAGTVTIDGVVGAITDETYVYSPSADEGDTAAGVVTITQPWTTKAKTVLNGAMYDAAGNVVGIVQLKVSKPSVNKKTGAKTVKVSGYLLPNSGKKVTLKSMTVVVSASAPTEVSMPAKQLGTFRVKIGNDGFLGSVGSYTAQTAAVGGKWTRADAKVYVDFSGTALPAGTIEDLLPDGEPVIAKGGKWSFGKASSVKYAKDAKTKAFTLTVNDRNGTAKNKSAMKLSYTPKTGVFKGSFKVYAIQGGKLKKFTVKVNGVVVDGEGSGRAVPPKSASAWTVSVK